MNREESGKEEVMVVPKGPTEMEEACFFLDLRVRYMFETDASQYPSDQQLKEVYPESVELFFNRGLQEARAF